MSQPAVNIGLVGHIDHGKTTLLQALSGKWADTHSEERKRGITIRLGYADTTFYRCSKCTGAAAYSPKKKCPKCGGPAERIRTVSFVDAPGHETLMATMISGAAIMDGALLVIAANEPCPSPQTKEHLMALEIVGIKNVVVAQNKIDLVSGEGANENYKQIKEFLKGTIAENAPVIPVSAQRNVNVDALIQAIEEVIQPPKRGTKKDPRMFVVRSFDVNKPGAGPKELTGGVLGGALAEGELKKGDTIELHPGIKKGEKWIPIQTKITSLLAGGEKLEKVHPGGSIGVCTSLDPSLTKSDNLSGNLAGYPGKLPPLREELDLNLHLLERVVGLEKEIEVAPIRIGEPLMMIAAATTTVGVVSKSSKGTIHTRLKLPVCALPKDRIVIARRIGQRWRLVGYGIVM
jgi:translation initiation factor 2 subunit 3